MSSWYGSDAVPTHRPEHTTSGGDNGSAGEVRGGTPPESSVACIHEWEYDEEESKGPWTGYIERCKHCGAIQQVPQ